jgi:murein L,D-transpeptidase YcbB/YkuD
MSIRGLRYDRLLAGTAVLALALSGAGAAIAQGQAATPAATPDVPATTNAVAPLADEHQVPPPPAANSAASDQPALRPSAGAPAPAPAGEQPAVSPATPAAAAAGEPAAAPSAPAVAAEEPAPPPDPFAAVDPADRPVAEKVWDLLNGKSDRTFTNRKERAAVQAFYESRKRAPIWLDKGVVTSRAKAVIKRLNDADTDGLDPNDYKTPNFDGVQNPDVLAEAELKLTEAVLTYARHVQAGRFPYSRIHHDIEMPQQPPEPADVLAKVADAADAAKALDEFSPPHEGYKRLKAMLAQLRHKSGGSGFLTDGAVLKLSKVPMEDARVPSLRTRLGITGDPNDQRYDVQVAEAVKKFQRSNGLPATGSLDSRTVKELNGPPRDRQIELIMVNMERWRWLPRDLGQAYVMVNIPEYQLRVFRHGQVIWTTRVVVGKPSMATPILTAQMKYITVNPTWNVPPSIVHNEYLPALAQDPTVLQRMGLRVDYNRDGSVHIWQPPGDGNALGRLRFNFPNRFLVYQHDTPDKYMFSHDTRAYSHGCMRVLDPPKYAEVLLNITRPSEGWTAERVKRMYGGAEQDIQFPTSIPVNLTYQTAFVDDAGRLQTLRDIYGIDSKMLSAIRSERGMIEVAAAPAEESDKPHERRQRTASAAQRLPQGLPPPRQGGFFQSLFGGGYSNGYAGPYGRPIPPNRIR